MTADFQESGKGEFEWRDVSINETNENMVQEE